MSRRHKLVFIHVFLAIQIALPLQYYLLRADENDERFAWRMFSPIRMVRCGSGPRLRSPPRFTVDDQPVNLYREFHEAWVTVSRRGRREVIERMALALCDRNPDSEVHVRYACRSVDGEVETESAGGWDVCRTGSL